MPIKVQESYRTPNRLEQKKKSPYLVIIKTLNIQNKENISKASKQKDQETYKDRPIE